MKNWLIVHPEDTTTKFLNNIYANLKDKTVLTGGVNKPELRKLIDNHSRCIFCGPGSLNGLFSVGKRYNHMTKFHKEL
jgi:hypothetical protein